jgi:TPR repeat protein
MNKAIELWKVAEERGSLEASYRIASCHRTGEGVPKDVEKAFSKYQELVTKDYPEAHVSLFYSCTLVICILIVILIYTYIPTYIGFLNQIRW